MYFPHQKPHLATDNEMSYFHNPDYIEFIKKISPAAVKDIQIDNSGAKCSYIRQITSEKLIAQCSKDSIILGKLAQEDQ
jgi:acetoin utilization deacetylase AcuC-like enzyme